MGRGRGSDRTTIQRVSAESPLVCSAFFLRFFIIINKCESLLSAELHAALLVARRDSLIYSRGAPCPWVRYNSMPAADTFFLCPLHLRSTISSSVSVPPMSSAGVACP
eukprot:scaffold4498_cov119-Isochrysis_galbana.AAC.16